jgi:hypothetical protein
MSRCALVVLALASTTARADTGGQCHVLEVDFTTADDSSNAAAPYHFRPQMVVWLEKADGSYVDTLYITQETGTYGIGNRPGRFDFNSGPIWPYGRRITTFPVWAHKDKPDLVADGVYPFPVLEYQDKNDNNLSHSTGMSSTEHHFCRPLDTHEAGWGIAMDGMTCATNAFTDKGEFSQTLGTTGYPPRTDVVRSAQDSMDVDMYPIMNRFDAVSQATPQYGIANQVLWPIPADLPQGDYVMFAEVSKEFDYNATYNATTYPSPCDSCIPYSTYGAAYRGQPSVIYKVPFTVGAVESIGNSDTYVGYGDPDGLDGMIRLPDSSITSDVPGSGAARLSLMADPSGMFRLKVQARPEFDAAPPGAADELKTTALTATGASVSFVAPGDDGDVGTVRGYDIHYRAGDEITADNFDSSPSIDSGSIPSPDEAGQIQAFDLAGLLPETDYYVGIRGFDKCHNTGPLAVLKFTTPPAPVGEVDACFVATAAYGSVMATNVGMLRRFRDAILRHTVLGELFVETYYTFGPAVAGVVDESELMRATAREALGPLVQLAGSVKPDK